MTKVKNKFLVQELERLKVLKGAYKKELKIFFDIAKL
jgi:hypothetical protein